jgi:hypothetical protein
MEFGAQPALLLLRRKLMILTKRSLAVSATVFIGILGFAPAASATIHPIVESFDCASDTAFDNHPLGDVADPPGVTPGYGSHSDTSSLRSLIVITDGFQDFSSPAISDFKLDDECGHSGP